MRWATKSWTPAGCLTRLLLAMCCLGLVLGGTLLTPTRAQAAVNLTLTKSVNVSLATPGNLIYFKLTVKNSGDVAATNVVVTDPLPSGCSFLSATLGGFLSNGLCVWNLGTVAPGASVDLILNVKINLGILLASISNTAQLTCPQLAVPLNSNSVQIGISLSLLPSLTLTKSCSVTAAATGSLITYTLTVKNDGQGAATNVVLTDPIPAGCTPTAASNGGSVSNGVCTWNLGSLAAGASLQVTLQVKINLGVSGSISNIAHVGCSEQGSGCDSNNSIITVKAPKLILTKSVSLATAWVDKLVTYTILVKNGGDSPASNIVISDPLPLGCVAVSLSTGGVLNGGTCTWNVASLAVGATVQVSVQVKITGLVLGILHNIASATCNEQPNPGSSNSSDCNVIPPPPPSLGLNKSINVSVAIPGAQVTYYLSVKNNGGQTATNVTISDPLPAGLSFVSASNGGQFSNGYCTWNVGSLAPGASIQVSLQATVNLGIVGTLTNTAKVNCTETPTFVISNSVSLKVEALKLSLTKAVDLSLAAPGSLVTFTLTVNNLGPGTANNIVLTDPLPAGCSLVGLSLGGILNNGICTWNLGSLAPGASVQVTLQVKVNLGITAAISNTAKVICAEIGTAVSSNKVTVAIALPRLALTKAVNAATSLPGGLLIYTLTVRNNGTAPATNCVLTDPLPTNCSLVGLSLGGLLNNGVCTWNLGNLAPWATVVVTMQVKINLGILGAISNTAKVLCWELAAVSSNTVNVNVVPPSLALTKVVNVATAIPGSLLTYTITCKNTGSVTANNCSISDQIPNALSILSISVGGLISGNSCSWNVGNLAPGASVQVTVQVKVNLGIALGVITNIAQTTCDGLTGPVSSNGASVNIGLL